MNGPALVRETPGLTAQRSRWTPAISFFPSGTRTALGWMPQGQQSPYGDVVTDEMSTASRKVAELVFPLNGAQAERKAS
jgi:hypothetical protein